MENLDNNDIEIYFENGVYGVKEKGILVVPLVYEDAIGAIDEWEYFERINIDEGQFLDHKRTHKEVTMIVDRLKKQISSIEKIDDRLSIKELMSEEVPDLTKQWNKVIDMHNKNEITSFEYKVLIDSLDFLDRKGIISLKFGI
jgi:hypothetical protein